MIFYRVFLTATFDSGVFCGIMILMERLILHCDLNNFYASVECVLNPALKNLPLAVSGNPEKRHGVILAKNELAKKAGVKTGDVIWEAMQKEPRLKCVPPHFSHYSEYSSRVFDIYTRFTNKVEPFGPDECWLDCTGAEKQYGSGVKLADTIRQTVKKETGLTVSVGVSFNKVFAKLGSDMKKPDGTTLISSRNFRQKIWGLPVSDMLMIGKKTAAALAKLNVSTIGELAAADEKVLKAHFGINGIKMKNNALGLDDEPVREYVKKRKAESIGHGMTAMKDIRSYDQADVLIAYLSEKVATRLRKTGVRGYGVHLTIRSANDISRHVSAQKRLEYPVLAGLDVEKAAKELLRSLWKEDYPVRTLTVSVFSLVPENSGGQISLFDDDKRVKNENLEKALDKIRNKYGADTIVRAGLYGTDFVYDKNDDEDFLPFKR